MQRDGGPACETIAGVTATEESPFLRACRREPVPYTPVWYMRQAGRSLPEYRKARGSLPMLKACTRPEVITEITLQPLRRYDVDAAILFSDIVVPLKALGLDIDIKAGIGPVIAKPIRRERDLARLRNLEPADVPFVTAAVKALVAELGAKPLIGFAGGPFTLASYLIEGGPSKSHDRTKSLMYGNPAMWHALLARLTDITIAFLQVQISAGASAVQLFDSWVGTLDPGLPGRGAPAQQADLRDARRGQRAAPPLRGRYRGTAGADERSWGGRSRCGLAGQPGRGGAPGRDRHRAAGQPRPGRAADALGGGQAAGQGRAVPRPRRGRAHLQPRARGAARDRPR